MYAIRSYYGGAPEHGCKNIPLGLECYTESRFIALTGTNAVGDASTLHDASFNGVVAQYFPIGEVVTDQEWTTVAHPDSCPIEDDTRLIEKALKTESPAKVFGSSNKASFKDLWTRITSYNVCYTKLLRVTLRTCDAWGVVTECESCSRFQLFTLCD